MEESDADEEGRCGTDTGPDGIGCADGDVFLGNKEEDAAQRHGDYGKDNPEDAGRGVKRSEFHADRPANFAYGCEE